MANENEAVDKVAELIKTVIKGWPVYAVIVGLLWGYGEFWLDAKIATAIKTQTVEQPAMVAMTGAVQTNTNTINRVESKVEIVEEDTKAILRIMAQP